MSNGNMKSRDQEGYDTFTVRPDPKPEEKKENFQEKQAREKKTYDQLTRLAEINRRGFP